jgi:hypothetical protein
VQKKFKNIVPERKKRIKTARFAKTPGQKNNKKIKITTKRCKKIMQK